MSTCDIFCEILEISEIFSKIDFLDIKSYLMIKENKNNVEMCNKIENSLKFDKIRKFLFFFAFLLKFRLQSPS